MSLAGMDLGINNIALKESCDISMPVILRLSKTKHKKAWDKKSSFSSGNFRKQTFKFLQSKDIVRMREVEADNLPNLTSAMLMEIERENDPDYFGGKTLSINSNGKSLSGGDQQQPILDMAAVSSQLNVGDKQNKMLLVEAIYGKPQRTRRHSSLMKTNEALVADYITSHPPKHSSVLIGDKSNSESSRRSSVSKTQVKSSAINSTSYIKDYSVSCLSNRNSTQAYSDVNKKRDYLKRKEKAKVLFSPSEQPVGETVAVDTFKARSSIDVVRICLKELRWREYPFGRRDGCGVDVYWQSVSFQDSTHYISAGCVNKFPGINHLMHKINLSRSLRTMRKLYPTEYNFFPRTWFLPQQFQEWKLDASLEDNQDKFYIVKPDNGAQGEGIYLVGDPVEYVHTNRDHVVQEYLSNVLLIDGFKFDFRVYAVLFSLEPLSIYISKEGLARFCTLPYEQPTNENQQDIFRHLTNYSLNKKSCAYHHGDDNPDNGSKRTLTSVLRYLQSQGHDSEEIWHDVQEIVCKTLLSVVPELKIEYVAQLGGVRGGNVNCFQILGFDIILLDTMKPVLLEVNSSPSLRIDGEREISSGILEYFPSPVDIAVKKPLVKEVLEKIVPKRKSKLARQKREMQGAHNRNKEDPYSRFSLQGESDDGRILQEIYPKEFGKHYRKLRIMERIANIFQISLGVRGALRMGMTSFRNFIRKYRLLNSGVTSASLDLVFLDALKRWEFMNPEKCSGLCFQGFVEVFFSLARKRFNQKGITILDAVEQLVEHCESSIDILSDGIKDLSSSNSQHLISSKEDRRIVEIQSIYNNTYTRKMKLTNDFCINYQGNQVKNSSKGQKSKVNSDVDLPPVNHKGRSKDTSKQSTSKSSNKNILCSKVDDDILSGTEYKKKNKMKKIKEDVLSLTSDG